MLRIEELLYSFFPFTPTAEQKYFFRQLADFLNKKGESRSAFLLTGYAGTGKTSCLQTLFLTAKELGWKVVFLAPTGRSAKIISKSTGQEAHTLHRHIYQHNEDPFSSTVEFKLRRNYRNNCLFVVDEASMISVEEKKEPENDLLTDLIQFVFENSGNKLILVGDSAQLPPVRNTLSLALHKEILQYVYQLKIHACQLTEVSRQQAGSGILSNATTLREILSEPSKEFRFNSSSFPDTFQLTEERIPDGISYAYEKFGIDNTVLLCATNKETSFFNALIRQKILKKSSAVCKGELLMVNRNNYQALPSNSKAGFLANGDFIEVTEVWPEETFGSFEFINLTVKLPDYPKQAPFRCKILKETLLSPEASLGQHRSQELFSLILHKYRQIKSQEKKLKALKKDPYLNALHVKYAYAITCHKAQGGQWDAVFVHPAFWQNKASGIEKIRWLYTAITRASKELYLVQ